MNHHHRDRLVATICGLAVLAAAGLLTAGCASAQPSTTSATAKTSTPSLTYAAPGKHAVGYREFTTTGAQQQPLTLRAWYPARRPADKQPGDDHLHRAQQVRRTDPSRQGDHLSRQSARERSTRTDRQAIPARGLLPWLRDQPDRVQHTRGALRITGLRRSRPRTQRDLRRSLDGFWKALIDRPVDIRRTIDYAEQLNKPGAALAGMIDMDNIAVVGHSYGGYTALAAAGARFDFAAYKTRCAALTADDPLNFFCGPVIPKESDMATRAGLGSVPSGLWPSFGDPRVKAVISMAGDAYPFDQRGLAELKVPVMAMGGTIDEGTPYTWGAKLTYDHAASKNKTLITFPGAGHMLFVDPCDNLPGPSLSRTATGSASMPSGAHVDRSTS